MNETLTLDLIRDAQNNGLEGTSAVLSAMGSRLDMLASAAAKRLTANGLNFYDHVEDFRQDAALAMFEALPRFTGADVDTFLAFMWSTVENVLKDKVREHRNQGADEDAVKVFASMLERADGDVFLAEKFAQTIPPKGRRLSADRAQAARLAWMGALSLDMPARVTEGPWDGDQLGSVVENLASDLGVPEDLITPEDISSEERRQKHAVVTAILDVMTPNQANALRYSYGINGFPTYGTGDSGDLEGLARAMAVTTIQARDARTKGHKSFAKRYIKAVARTKGEAFTLTEAAARNLGRGGRK